MELDVVIRGASVLDGTGRAAFAGDVGVFRGRVRAVAEHGALSAPRVVEAYRRTLAPGFVDLHSHSDWVLDHPEHDEILEPLLAQGVTTLVAGNCGISPAPVTPRSRSLLDRSSGLLRDAPLGYSWTSMAEWLVHLEDRGVALNIAMLVGHGTLRQLVMGNDSAVPDRARARDLGEATRQALRDGAYGLSLGLAYAPGVFAREQELTELARVTRDEGAILTVHGRAYTWVSPFYSPLPGKPHNLRSVEELTRVARSSGVRLQLSHQIFIGRRTWSTWPRVLGAIDRAAAEGLDVGFDAFPYTFGNTTIQALLPAWVLKNPMRRLREKRSVDRLRREFFLLRYALGLDYSDVTLLWGATPELEPWEGLDLGEIARRRGQDPFETYVQVALASNGQARVLIGTYSGDGDEEGPLRAVLSHPRCSFETDTILTRRGRHNPASFGTFPRVLGRYARDLALFSLPEAVRRMTSLPAERIGLRDVGRIAPGARADFVLFDPETIADTTRPGVSDSSPTGIHEVWIAGEPVLRDGRRTGGPRRGSVLRRS